MLQSVAGSQKSGFSRGRSHARARLRSRSRVQEPPQTPVQMPAGTPIIDLSGVDSSEVDLDLAAEYSRQTTVSQATTILKQVSPSPVAKITNRVKRRNK